MDAHRIEYAPTPPLHHRKRVRQVLFLLALVLILAPLVWKFGPFASRQTKIHYWQRQAMNYSPSANQVVFDDASLPFGQGQKPVGLTQVEVGVGYGRSAPPAKPLEDLVTGGDALSLATLYMGMRTSNTGNVRLVVVSTFETFNQGGWGSKSFECVSRVVRPATVLTPPVFHSSHWAAFIDFGKREHIRFFAGQPDNSDPSHFTITYESDSRPATIDGWLLDDDTIKLQKRP